MDYNGLNAKIKAMRRNLLTRRDFEILCNLPSVIEIAEKLREYPAYRHALAQTEGMELHRGVVEQKLMISLADDFMRIYGFISDFKMRKYLNAYFESFEIGIIKILLCMVYDERDISTSIDDLTDIIASELKINVSKLRDSKTVADFIQSLKGAGFYSMLADSYTPERSLFEIETQLDLYYYMNIWRQQSLWLDKGNRRIMESIKGAEVDLRNMMWVYRLKKYYKVNDSRIYAYLIPVSRLLTRTHLMKMVECRTLTDLSSEIKSSPYGGLFSDMEHMEASFNRHMSYVYRKAAAMHPQSIALTVGYLFFKELEINNIISLLEGVRYKLNPNDVMSYLNLSNELEVK
ncbi:MAG: V-type ATPase subunit [Clostridiales bacterium]|jgi:V/A-type H+-transporting ATPase subunit C|nr:V-type ATPase subunit [Clostridiales bacterium]